MSIISVNKYKTELLKDIINAPKIIEAIDSQQPDAVINEPDSLIYKNIFPYIRIPDTQSKADTYILLSVDIDRINRNNKTYAMYRTVFWVLSHKESMEMEGQNATRIDYIGEEIKTLFDGQQKFGFSEFELWSNREILLNEKYHYRELVFTCNDLRHPVSMLGRGNKHDN
jgi:hypothetical protein